MIHACVLLFADYALPIYSNTNTFILAYSNTNIE